MKKIDKILTHFGDALSRKKICLLSHVVFNLTIVWTPGPNHKLIESSKVVKFHPCSCHSIIWNVGNGLWLSKRWVMVVEVVDGKSKLKRYKFGCSKKRVLIALNISSPIYQRWVNLWFEYGLGGNIAWQSTTNAILIFVKRRDINFQVREKSPQYQTYNIVMQNCLSYWNCICLPYTKGLITPTTHGTIRLQ